MFICTRLTGRFFYSFFMIVLILLPFLSFSQGVDTLFFDDFESGLNKWQVSGQDWNTTSVTFRSGNHSITESPDGNYPGSSNATITLANSIDLTTTNIPVLAFWHRYNVQTSYDYCNIEVSEDGGFTWTLLERFTGFTNSLHPYQIDLSAYKTTPIQIRFRLRDNGNTVYDGWYLDDISITEQNTTLTTFPFFEDFENGFDNWLVSGQDWNTTTNTFRSSEYAITESRIGNYPGWANSTITLANPIDLATTDVPVLTFWHRYNVQTNYDYCNIEVSEDGGFTWTLLERFTGFINSLHPYQIDLSDYKTTPIQIRFRLRDNGNTVYDGWYLDDISIAEQNTALTTFPFFEDFENGFDNWLVSGQDWDTTKITFRSLDYAITESPNGNYPGWANSTITLANPIDLATSDMPVLTFWHRYNVQTSYDYCNIEVSEDGGFTWVLLKRFTGFTNSLHPYQIDLSGYKTIPIQIRFRLRDNGNTVYGGWYLDDISIAEQNTAITPIPFFEDFENGFDNWLVSGQDWDTTKITFRSPDYAITESPNGNYPGWANSTITLANPVDLSETNLPVLIFWHRYNAQTNYDFCYVEISVNGGYNWELLESFTGFTNTLFLTQLNLSEYKVESVLIRFRMRDNGNTVYDGWYIDDVEIKDLNPTTVADNQFKSPKKYELHQNYPNPFNPTSVIRYDLPKSSFVNLTIYNALGQKVATLVNRKLPAGSHNATFDANGLTSGVYFYRIKANNFVQTRKMLLLR